MTPKWKNGLHRGKGTGLRSSEKPFAINPGTGPEGGKPRDEKKQVKGTTIETSQVQAKTKRSELSRGKEEEPEIE